MIVYSKNGSLNDLIQILLPLYLPSITSGYTRNLLVSYVQEKSERFKEMQKIMGMT